MHLKENGVVRDSQTSEELISRLKTESISEAMKTDIALIWPCGEKGE